MRSHCIGGEWIPGAGPKLYAQNPATGEIVWEGNHAILPEILQAIHHARGAFENWSSISWEKRKNYLKNFAKQVQENSEKISERISIETGKPLWESALEVESMFAKVENTIQAFKDRCRDTFTEASGIGTATRYKPHGTLAILSPFNFPGHLPGSHILPALLSGNTIVFKPSERTPGVAQLLMELWQASDLPPGVLNLIQGGRETGALLLQQQKLDGVLFTGSVTTGKTIAKMFSETPGKILALEMGGNNPLLVWGISDIQSAAYLTILSAYITAGQRCTCARRLIIPDSKDGEAFLDCLISMIPKIRVGPYTETPEPFMGPLISLSAAQALLSVQQALIGSGAKALVPMRLLAEQTPFLSPGILDVTAVKNRGDTEHFGPLLQVIRVKDFESAIVEANNTAFGLTSALLSDDENLYKKFFSKVRAGILHWNRQTTGTSGVQPFGGIGDSGNLRPSGYFAVDYCVYPVASMESSFLKMPPKTLPGIVLP
jgi:succinylglutamic semialdehyde dehydrogenase